MIEGRGWGAVAWAAIMLPFLAGVAFLLWWGGR